jgi:hypothetical protein
MARLITALNKSKQTLNHTYNGVRYYGVINNAMGNEMSTEADQLREFFNHEVTDAAADKLDKMELYIDRLEVSIKSSAAMLSMLSNELPVRKQVESINNLLKG